MFYASHCNHKQQTHIPTCYLCDTVLMLQVNQAAEVNLSKAKLNYRKQLSELQDEMKELRSEVSFADSS